MPAYKTRLTPKNLRYYLDQLENLGLVGYEASEVVLKKVLIKTELYHLSKSVTQALNILEEKVPESFQPPPARDYDMTLAELWGDPEEPEWMKIEHLQKEMAESHHENEPTEPWELDLDAMEKQRRDQIPEDPNKPILDVEMNEQGHLVPKKREKEKEDKKGGEE